MRNFQIIVFISTQTYGEIFKSSVPLNLGTFQLKPLQGGHLSKADKNFCPVSVRLREIPLYQICRLQLYRIKSYMNRVSLQLFEYF